MIKYGDLVQYIKDNHINWNTDLFEVLRGFFDEYSQQSHPLSPHHIQYDTDMIIPDRKKEFNAPEDGEYTSQDLLDLFST
jgi:hypothetical protein